MVIQISVYATYTKWSNPPYSIAGVKIIININTNQLLHIKLIKTRRRRQMSDSRYRRTQSRALQDTSAHRRKRFWTNHTRRVCVSRHVLGDGLFTFLPSYRFFVPLKQQVSHAAIINPQWEQTMRQEAFSCNSFFLSVSEDNGTTWVRLH